MDLLLLRPPSATLKLVDRHCHPIFTSLELGASSFQQTRKVRRICRSEASLSEGRASNTSRRRNLGTLPVKEESLHVNSNIELLQDVFDPRTKEATETGRAEGLGIIEFLKDKNIFITGGTGFLAKVLVERILQAQPSVGQLYLLIKAEDLYTAQSRLKREIVDAQLFKCLKRRYGNSYEEFMMKKLTPVVGNVALEDLGLDKHTKDVLTSKINIIVNSAANTTFDERYDLALNVNTKGPQRVLELGKRCPHLQLLLFVSTAFVNGQRKGIVHEQHFRMGQSIAAEMLGKQAVPDLNVEAEIKLVGKTIRDVLAEDHTADTNDRAEEQTGRNLTQTLKELGLKRAKMYGWQDTYVFTKAMGEMLIESMREQLPVVILRPSVVESTIRQPFPGWIEGCRMMDPIILSYGKGLLTGFLADRDGIIDVVPADMVANAMLAAMVKHASNPGLKVYQVASSLNNPLFFGELSRIIHEHFTEHPYVDNAGRHVKPQRMKLFQNMESFMAFLDMAYEIDKLASCMNRGGKFNKHKNLILKAKKQAIYFAKLYKPYTFYEGRFDISNTEQLYCELSSQERGMFKFDIKAIDWEYYIYNIHIPGLREHVLKGRGTDGKSLLR